TRHARIRAMHDEIENIASLNVALDSKSILIQPSRHLETPCSRPLSADLPAKVCNQMAAGRIPKHNPHQVVIRCRHKCTPVLLRWGEGYCT
ncbi:hypothetical protein JI435_404770, partial [Parastagonospora nodorum SN15]